MKSALMLLLGALAAPPSSAVDDRAREREQMVLTVANIAATSGPARYRRIDPSVLQVMRRVPRHLFVPGDARRDAYADSALAIGHGATISQPYIVALMTDLLDVRKGDKVLEVGTGSGYQAAVLAELGARVHSIEIVEPLARRASSTLAGLGYRNVTVRAGDGYRGWPDQAPFDRIIVTAGADHIPKPLTDQLRPGGRLVIPVGRGSEQLTLIVKHQDGRLASERVIGVRFVPLVRGEAD